MIGKIIIKKNNYQDIFLETDEELIELNFIKKINFFNNDLVELQNNTIEIISSEIMNGIKIPGILIIENTTKYGLNKRKNPYYLFKPLDWKLPNFLVGSSHKKRENLYLEIKFHKWEKKLPYGIINNTFGPEKDINNLFETLLSYYNIDTTNLDKIVNYSIKDDIDNRTKLSNKNIITIDPENCLDMDDAIHFKPIGENQVEIGIHITDVSSYISEGSDIDIIASNRITSVYAPHKVINMLPNLLADNICSLKENSDKRCISLIINFDYSGKMLDYQILPSLINVNKNYTYSEFEKFIKKNKNSNENNFFEFCKLINLGNLENNNYDSHKMVEKLMVLANHLVCKDLINNNNKQIIVRSHKESFDPELQIIPKEIYQDVFYKFMNSAEYNLYDNDKILNHSGLGLNQYTHFTSPIRRYSDIITHRLVKSRWFNSDYQFDVKLIDSINTKNKQIKKLDREFKIYQIINQINSLDILDAFVVELNVDSKITIFIPKFKVELKTVLIHSKIKSLFDFQLESNCLTIKNSENKQFVKIKKYQKIKIRLFEKNNTKYKIDINFVEPNIKELIMSD